MDPKLTFTGIVVGVQPRIRLTRSFDEAYHGYLGYILRLRGIVADKQGEFTVGVGPATHAKHHFKFGMAIQGKVVPVDDPELETADYCRVSQLVARSLMGHHERRGPPFESLAPPLEAYRERGCRRLAAPTYAKSCKSCVWGCEMAVEMIIDQWNPSKRKYRRETFCYGPKSCPLFRAGPTRKVPGRKGMTWEETDEVDEDATGHRGRDE